MSLNHSSANAVTFEQLLSYQDECFIRAAYQALLGRAPDNAGLRYYLASVRAGARKLEILSQFELSAEGQARQERIATLDKAISSHQRLRTPLIGPLLRLAGVARPQTTSGMLSTLYGIDPQARQYFTNAKNDSCILHTAQFLDVLPIQAECNFIYNVLEMVHRKSRFLLSYE